MLHALKDLCGCRLFVETDTFHGGSSRAASEIFAEVITCEYSADIQKIVLENLKDLANITSYHGDSPVFLQNARERFTNEATCFSLEAHWCASAVEVGSPGQTRLLEELTAIGSLNAESAIFIDDARYYSAPPKPPNKWAEWLDLPAVIAALNTFSEEHFVMFYKDVLCFLPTARNH